LHRQRLAAPHAHVAPQPHCGSWLFESATAASWQPQPHASPPQLLHEHTSFIALFIS
jgi:hypothetical protein